MKKIRVKFGHHSPSLLSRRVRPIIYTGIRNSFSTYVKIPKSSSFKFPGDDIWDWSKLFGISFGHHQKNESYRFGFRIREEDKIDMSLYMYRGGRREIESLPFIEFDKLYKFSICRFSDSIIASVQSSDGVYLFKPVIKEISNFKCWGYTLGIYIGGNLTAPRDLMFYYL